MLAILFDITWTLSSCAIMPVAAVWRARMAVFLAQALCVRDFGELLDRRAPHVALLLQDAGDLGVGACHLDHARHLDDAAHVRFFDIALHDSLLRRRLGLHARRRRIGGG